MLEVHVMDAQADEQVKTPIDHLTLCEAQHDDNQLEELRTNEKEKFNFWLRKFRNTELWTLKSSSGNLCPS